MSDYSEKNRKKYSENKKIRFLFKMFYLTSKKLKTLFFDIFDEKAQFNENFSS
jgi:hypothetical protein